MTLVVKAPINAATSRILTRRATCIGIQYVLEDSVGTHVVTVNNGCIGYSCDADQHSMICEHITMVEKQQAAYVDEAARREAYVAIFGIYDL